MELKHKDIKFYLFLYKLFKQKNEGRYYIEFNQVRETLNRRLHKIPRVLHYEFLKEMERFPKPLIRRVGSTNGKHIGFELIGGDIDKHLNQFNLPI